MHFLAGEVPSTRHWLIWLAYLSFDFANQPDKDMTGQKKLPCVKLGLINILANEFHDAATRFNCLF